MSEQITQRRTDDEVFALKLKWIKTPTWNLVDTEGFEAHRKELEYYQKMAEETWTAPGGRWNLVHITDQFSKDLSPLARRIYATIYEATVSPEVGTYFAEWYIADALGDRGLCTSAEFHTALKELTGCYLIRELHDLGCRYELTSKAWRAHLWHEIKRSVPSDD